MKNTPRFLSSLVAVAAVLACAGVRAQSVQIYGVVDAGLEVVTDVGAAGSTLTRLPVNTASVPSRLGFRGTEDLGNGLSAGFTLEQGLGVSNGTLGQGGRVFGRQAHVGLSGTWGSLSAGRQYTMLFWSILDTDILGPNAFGSGSLDSYIPNARADKSIAYRGRFDGLTVGATYSFGRDSVNAGPSPAGTNCAGEDPSDAKICREWSALVKYDTEQWGVALAHDRLHGGAGAFAGLTSGDRVDARTLANGYLKFEGGKVAVGLIRRDNDGNPATPRSDLSWIGGSYNLSGPWVIDGQLFRLDFKNSANGSTLLALRATYNFSKRTAAYVSVGSIQNDGTSAVSVSGASPGSNPVAGASQKGLITGIRHSF